MTTCNDWFASSRIAVLCAVSLAAFASGAGLTYHLSAPKVRAGERASLEIRLPAPAGEQEPPPIHDDLLTQDSHYKLLSKDVHREGNEFVWTYQITAYQPGNVRIPPVEIQAGAETFSTEALPLEVTTGRAENDESLRPEFGSLRLPLRWKILFGLLALFAATYAAARAFEKYVKPRLRRKPQMAPVQPPVPEQAPEEWLRVRLKELERKSHDEQAVFGALVDELTYVMREYFSRRSHQPVTAWTTPEMGRRLKGDTIAEASREVLERCDRFKFAGEKNADAKALFQFGLVETERRILACGT